MESGARSLILLDAISVGIHLAQAPLGRSVAAVRALAEPLGSNRSIFADAHADFFSFFSDLSLFMLGRM